MTEHLATDEATILKIDSEDWSPMTFYRSHVDGELSIEICDAMTWLTIHQARALRDWLVKEFP